jgi:hypothetical protein
VDNERANALTIGAIPVGGRGTLLHLGKWSPRLRNVTWLGEPKTGGGLEHVLADRLGEFEVAVKDFIEAAVPQERGTRTSTYGLKVRRQCSSQSPVRARFPWIQGVLCSEPAGSRWTPLDNGGPMEAAGDLLDWVGENTFADDISEAEARNLFPAAFCH